MWLPQYTSFSPVNTNHRFLHDLRLPHFIRYPDRITFVGSLATGVPSPFAGDSPRAAPGEDDRYVPSSSSLLVIGWLGGLGVIGDVGPVPPPAPP